MPDEDLPQLPTVADPDFKKQIIDICTPIIPRKIAKKDQNKVFEPTNDQRFEVFMMLASGMTEENIMMCITNPNTGKPVTKKTFNKCFIREKELGNEYATYLIASKMFREGMNMDGNTPPVVAQRAREFWLSRKGGDQWSSKNTVEHNHFGKIQIEEVGDAINQLGRLALNRLKQLGDSGVDKSVESGTGRRTDLHMEVLSPSDPTDPEG